MSHSLDAALSVAGFSKAEAIVLRFGRANAYYPSNQSVFPLSAREIERRTGLDKSNASRAIASLVSGNVLRKVGDEFELNLDFSSWAWKGSPRLSPKEIEFCQGDHPSTVGCTANAPLVEEPTEALVKQPTPVGRRTNAPLVEEPTPPLVVQPTPPLVEEPTPRTRYIGTRAELDLIQIELDHSRGASDRVHTPLQASLRAETQPESKSVPTLPTTPAQLTVVEILLERLGENPKDFYSDNRALCQVAVDGWTTAGHSDAEQRSAVHLAGANGVQGPRIIPYATKVLASAAAKRAATATVKPYVAGTTPAAATPGLWIDPRTEAEKEADRKMRELRASKLPPNPLLRRTP